VPRPTAPSNLVRPTQNTPFHIDYDWWAKSQSDLESYMAQHLCPEHRESFAGGAPSKGKIDWIDPLTGLVHRADQLEYTLLSHCSLQPDFITERTALVDAVFRALIAAGNRPMTPVELAERTSRSADTILRTLSGDVIYRGLRPFIEPA
jgi:hypothetical protein